MTNTERKASDLQSILSFLPFLLGYINRPLCFSHCNWPRLVVIFHGRRTSFRRDFLSRCNTTSVRDISRIKKGSRRSVFEDAFRFEQKTVKWYAIVSLFLSLFLFPSSRGLEIKRETKRNREGGEGNVWRRDIVAWHRFLSR